MVWSLRDLTLKKVQFGRRGLMICPTDKILDQALAGPTAGIPCVEMVCVECDGLTADTHDFAGDPPLVVDIKLSYDDVLFS
jgi:hypothetical protein